MKITIMKVPFASLIYEENDLSVVPAATVSIHGARLVAEQEIAQGMAAILPQ